jgi:hypothetical protein
MSTAQRIRDLALTGMPVADIARSIGVRYQRVYSTLRDSGMLAGLVSARLPGPKAVPEAKAPKPTLTVGALTAGGFTLACRWTLVDGVLILSEPLPKARGVYAFVKDDAALYVGLATMGLAKRIYFYGKPGITQRTSQRLNGLLKAELLAGAEIEIYTADPPNLCWNGLPVSGDAGLELGLIETYSTPWNMRGTKP